MPPSIHLLHTKTNVRQRDKVMHHPRLGDPFSLNFGPAQGWGLPGISLTQTGTVSRPGHLLFLPPSNEFPKLCALLFLWRPSTPAEGEVDPSILKTHLPPLIEYHLSFDHLRPRAYDIGPIKTALRWRSDAEGNTYLYVGRILVNTAQAQKIWAAAGGTADGGARWLASRLMGNRDALPTVVAYAPDTGDTVTWINLL